MLIKLNTDLLSFIYFTYSGESAFHAMMSGFGWAKYPIINRMDSLRQDVPITLIYGARSWVDNSASMKVKELRGGTSYVNVIVSFNFSNLISKSFCKIILYKLV